MRSFVRAGTILFSLFIVVEVVALWDVTGRAAFTRYYDPRRAARSAHGAGDLFAETGLEDATGKLEEVPNEFRLGLLPSGGGKHLLSVLTLAGPAAAAMVLMSADALLSRRRGARRSRG